MPWRRPFIPSPESDLENGGVPGHHLGYTSRFNQVQDLNHCLISSAISRLCRCVGLGKTFDKYTPLSSQTIHKLLITAPQNPQQTPPPSRSQTQPADLLGARGGQHPAGIMPGTRRANRAPGAFRPEETPSVAFTVMKLRLKRGGRRSRERNAGSPRAAKRHNQPGEVRLPGPKWLGAGV
ncbi:hypothetical protein FN846DRAFT_933302 [Sphaerosporella brunnea]|uniref:Uncharacterized protein n=1 Tax=Sphaerosporella brunnea TaxID=1250544 RepID=A0A5J5F6T8_9PEZI|nr:hypothetical protein FN846DRAFT_933302 [Sphaerosporella brunnea]